MKLTAPKQRQGDYYETLAKLYHDAQGLSFFAKNWHYKNIGELDLVMIDKTQKLPTLVIIEVRQRTVSRFGSDFGTALDSITNAKQNKIIKATEAFLQAHPQFDNHNIRFDVVSFDLTNDNNSNPTTADGTPIPTWITDAFTAN